MKPLKICQLYSTFFSSPSFSVPVEIWAVHLSYLSNNLNFDKKNQIIDYITLPAAISIVNKKHAEKTARVDNVFIITYLQLQIIYEHGDPGLYLQKT